MEHQEIHVQATPTQEQLADILMKRLLEHSFAYNCQSIMGWEGFLSIDGWECSSMSQKGAKNQIVTAYRLHTILDMRPSTTNNPMSNQDPKFTALPNYTLV